MLDPEMGMVHMVLKPPKRFRTLSGSPLRGNNSNHHSRHKSLGEVPLQRPQQDRTSYIFLQGTVAKTNGQDCCARKSKQKHVISIKNLVEPLGVSWRKRVVSATICLVDNHPVCESEKQNICLGTQVILSFIYLFGDGHSSPGGWDIPTGERKAIPRYREKRD